MSMFSKISVLTLVLFWSIHSFAYKTKIEKAIPKFDTIVRGKIYRSAMPVAKAWPMIKEVGINTILYLDDLEKKRVSFFDAKIQKKLVEVSTDRQGVIWFSGIRFHWYQLNDFDEEQTPDVDRFTEVLEFILDPVNQPVLIFDRKGTQKPGLVEIALRNIADGPWVEDFPEPILLDGDNKLRVPDGYDESSGLPYNPKSRYLVMNTAELSYAEHLDKPKHFNPNAVLWVNRYPHYDRFDLHEEWLHQNLTMRWPEIHLGDKARGVWGWFKRNVLRRGTYLLMTPFDVVANPVRVIGSDESLKSKAMLVVPSPVGGAIAGLGATVRGSDPREIFGGDPVDPEKLAAYLKMLTEFEQYVDQEQKDYIPIGEIGGPKSESETEEDPEP